MKRFYKMFGMTLLILSLVFMISCGDDDDDNGPTTPTDPTPTPTPTPTPVSCGGVEYDGYCWYYGEAEQSCDTVCETHGGCNADGIAYAGSEGSASACEAVLNALGAPVDTLGDGMDEISAAVFQYPQIGCSYDNDDGDRHVVWPGDCAASRVNISRACACNQ